MSGKLRLAIFAAVLGVSLSLFAATGLTRSARATEIAGRPAASQTPADGKKLYDAQCGICHQAGGTGAIMLSRRLGKDRSLLASRTDLTADYIRKIVRVGIGSMPPFSRIEVTDSELDLIAAYLTRPASDRAPPADKAQTKSPSNGAAHE